MVDPSILIVEDEQIIAIDLQRRLELLGYRITGVCSSSDRALKAVQDQKPDLVLMDVHIEGSLDGIGTAMRLKDEFQVPVVFLTAYTEPEIMKRAEVVEPLGYLIKPFKGTELQTTLQMALVKSRADRQLRDQELWHEAILSSIGDGVLAWEESRKIHYVNQRALDLLGIPKASIIGSLPEELFSLSEEDSLIPLRFLDHRETAPILFRGALLQAPDGQVHQVDGSLFPLKNGSRALGQVLTFRDVSEIRTLTKKLEHQARFDQLTGLANRKEFTQILQDRFHLSPTPQDILLYLDLDQFKLVNDTCGHLAGDELIRQTAEILRRQKDPHVLCLARLGGDEFAVLYEGLEMTSALEKAWMLKHIFNNTDFFWQGNEFRLKASIGLVAMEKSHFTDMKSVLAAADDACYMAKEEGGNRIKVYEWQDMNFQKRRGEMRWITRLGRALERDEFVLYSQPIVPLRNMEQLRAKEELLIRLQDADGTLIPPFEFISAAERYNLMPKIDRWVIRNAMALYQTVQQNRAVATVFTINLSGESLADPNLLSFIKHELKKNSADPSCFSFEITETAAVNNLAQAVTFINELKALGCCFALDDFGAGFSSFAYLKELPVDYIKIDGVFIKNLTEDPISLAMVEAIHKIGSVMGIGTIAEFVCSPEILKKLQEIGIDYSQGYETGRPAPLLG